MSLLFLAVSFAVGAVFGAKHQAITLFFYKKYKPLLDRLKALLLKKYGEWFKKQ